jgi:hypothetical protein
MVASACTWAADGTLPGAGAEADPYIIEDLADFDTFADSENAPTYWATGVYTKLACDPNLAGRTYTTAVIAPDTPDSTDGFDGIRFKGIFDGDGRVISNLTIDTAGAGNDYLGLFGSIDHGQIKNLGLEGGFVSGHKLVGGLVGHNTGQIWSCYSTGPVTGTDYDVGGLAGHNSGQIWNCYSTGPVTGTDYDVGGLAGHNNGSVSNCYATGHVSGNWYVGGLVGWNENGSVLNCYSTGDVNGASDVGGLVGINVGEVSNCFWDIETYGMTSSDGGTGLPTARMQTLSTFLDADWDFINTWSIGENQTCPYLRKYSPADINKDKTVNLIDLTIIAQHWMKGQ